MISEQHTIIFYRYIWRQGWLLSARNMNEKSIFLERLYEKHINWLKKNCIHFNRGNLGDSEESKFNI